MAREEVSWVRKGQVEGMVGGEDLEIFLLCRGGDCVVRAFRVSGSASLHCHLMMLRGQFRPEVLVGWGGGMYG